LTHASFGPDFTEVMARAAGAGVCRMVVTGADLHSSRLAAALAAAHPARLRSTAGVHPHQAAGFSIVQRAEFLQLLTSAAVVAVGECGLDYFRDLSPREAQRAAFAAQLELAVEVGKPVFLHQRDAHQDFTAMLRDFANRLSGGVAHCFTGGIAELETYLGMGLYIGVTGWVCDERRGQELRAAVPHIPSDRLLLETDAPYLLPRNLNPMPASRRNEPAFLPHVAATVAALRGEPIESLAAATTRNAVALFKL
jgi:TatD DNase family protein